MFLERTARGGVPWLVRGFMCHSLSMDSHSAFPSFAILSEPSTFAEPPFVLLVKYTMGIYTPHSVIIRITGEYADACL